MGAIMTIESRFVKTEEVVREELQVRWAVIGWGGGLKLYKGEVVLK